MWEESWSYYLYFYHSVWESNEGDLSRAVRSGMLECLDLSPSSLVSWMTPVPPPSPTLLVTPQLPKHVWTRLNPLPLLFPKAPLKMNLRLCFFYGLLYVWFDCVSVLESKRVKCPWLVYILQTEHKITEQQKCKIFLHSVCISTLSWTLETANMIQIFCIQQIWKYVEP